MKVIDGITMLKMIKDGTITNKTKLNCIDWVVSTSNNKVYVNREGIVKWKVSNVPLTQEVLLEHHFEIIEEDKKIEKLNIYEEKNEKNNWKWKCNGYNISAPQKIIADKINELIDEINKLKEEK